MKKNAYTTPHIEVLKVNMNKGCLDGSNPSGISANRGDNETNMTGLSTHADFETTSEDGTSSSKSKSPW